MNEDKIRRLYDAVVKEYGPGTESNLDFGAYEGFRDGVNKNGADKSYDFLRSVGVSDDLIGGKDWFYEYVNGQTRGESKAPEGTQEFGRVSVKPGENPTVEAATAMGRSYADKVRQAKQAEQAKRQAAAQTAKPAQQPAQTTQPAQPTSKPQEDTAAAQQIQQAGYTPNLSTEANRQYVLSHERPDGFGKRRDNLLDLSLGEEGRDLPELDNEAGKYTARAKSVAINFMNSPEGKQKMKEQLWENTQNQLHSLDNELQLAENDLKKQKEQLDKESGLSDWARRASTIRRTGTPSEKEKRYSENMKSFNHAKDAITAANSLLDDSYKLMAAAKDSKNHGITQNLVRGIVDGVFDVDAWTVGITDMIKSNTLLKALQKEDRGEQLTKEEEALVNAAVVNAAVQSQLSGELSRSYKAGMTTGESVPFMVEMMTGTRGVTSVTTAAGKGLMKAASKWLAKRGLKVSAKNAVAKNVAEGVAKFAKGNVDAAINTASIDLARVMNDYNERRIGDVQFDMEGDGLKYAGRDNVEEGATALLKSFSNVMFQTSSEFAGEQFVPFLNFFGKGIANITGLSRTAMYKTLERTVQMSPSMKKMRDFFNRTQWHGVFGEYLEEVYNNILSYGIGDMTKEELFDLDNNIDTFLGVGVTSAFFGTIGTAAYMRDRYQWRRQIKDFEKRWAGRTDIDLDDIKKRVGDMSIKEAGEYLKSIGKMTGLNDKEKKDFMGYVTALFCEGGYSSVNLNVEEESGDPTSAQVTEAVQESYDSGADAATPQEKQEVKQRYDAATAALNTAENDPSEQQFASLVQENSPQDGYAALRQQGYDDEHIQRAMDYYNARSAYEGLQDATIDSVDKKVEDGKKEVDANTHKESGMVIPVTDGSSNRAGHLISGNLVRNEDGTIDVENSDQVLIVRGEDGQQFMASPKNLSVTGETLSPDEMKQQIETTYRQSLLEEASAEVEPQATQEGAQAQQQEEQAAQQEEQAQQAEEQQPQPEPAPQATEGQPVEQQPVEQAPEGQQEEVQPEPQGEAQPQEPAADQQPTTPMQFNEQGEEMYESVDPQVTLDYLSEGSDEDEVSAMIEQNLDEAFKAYEKLKKKKPTPGKSKAAYDKAKAEYNAALEEAKRPVDYWKSVKQLQQQRIDAAKQEQLEAARQRAAQMPEEAPVDSEGAPDWLIDKPEDSRTRGFRMVGAEKVERQQPVEGLQGNETAVRFSEDRKPKGHLFVMEADQLQPSHRQGQRNPSHFIPEAQPKDRTDNASVLASQKIAQNINPEEITSTNTAYTGAPTVNARGEVVQGNNRSDALRQMWGPGYEEQAAKYKQYLMDHAEEFGLKKEDIEKMKAPVLVNRLDGVTDQEAIELGQFNAADTESGGEERINAGKTIQRLGGKISSFIDMLMQGDDDTLGISDLLQKNGLKALKWLAQQGIITNTQAQSTADKNGRLTDKAVEDLKEILFNSVFQGANPELRNVFNNLPAKAQRAILSTMYRDTQSDEGSRIKDHVQQAIYAYELLRKDEKFAKATTLEEARRAVKDWGNQYSFEENGNTLLNSDKFSNFALELAARFKGQTQKEQQTLLNRFFDLVQGVRKGDMFEEERGKVGLKEAVEETFGITLKEKDNGQNGSVSVAGDDTAGAGREQDGSGSGGQRERNPQGEGPAEPARGTDGNGTSGTEGAVGEAPVQGLESYTREEINDLVRDYVEEILEENGIDAQVQDIYIHGSRSRGDAHEDSDLDVVISYEGDEREDDMFNLLNDGDDPFVIEGIKVDINPIRKKESGTMEDYIERSKKYDEEVAKKKAESEKSSRNTIYPDKKDLTPAQKRTAKRFEKVGGVFDTKNGDGSVTRSTHFKLDGKTIVDMVETYDKDGNLVSRKYNAYRTNFDTPEQVAKFADKEANVFKQHMEPSPAMEGQDVPNGTAYYLFDGEYPVTQRTTAIGTPYEETTYSFYGETFTSVSAVKDAIDHIGTESEQREWEERVRQAGEEGIDYVDSEGRKYNVHYGEDEWGDKKIFLKDEGYRDRELETPKIRFELYMLGANEVKKDGPSTAKKKSAEKAKDGNGEKGLPSQSENESETKPESSAAEEDIELTEEDIRNADLPQETKTLALEYLKGNRSMFNQLGYETVKQYVRNQSRSRSGDSQAADQAQLGTENDGASRGQSGQSGSQNGQVDSTEDEGTSSGSRPSGESGQNNMAASDGEGSDRGLLPGESEVPVGNTGGVQRGGSRRRGSTGHNGSKRNGQGRSGSLPRNDGGRSVDASSKRNTSVDQEIADTEQAIIDALKDSFMPKRDKLYDVTTLMAGLGVNAIKVLTLSAKLGGLYVKKGYLTFRKWSENMHKSLDAPLANNTTFTPEDIDEFIKECWNASYEMDGQTHLISEWADILGQEQLRKQMALSIEEKVKLQKAAEGKPTVLGDIDNIREALPFLLPKQQEDVEKAEKQFFDPSHKDDAHGNGKGYMFTNGTGTGKTYTGLGIAKRFLNQGKKRILIVTAQESKINDFIRDAKNLGIEARMLTDTKDKGKGVVVTQYANMYQNYALLEDTFDLIIYDESHKIQENKEGSSTARSQQHHMLSNRDPQQAILRRLQNTQLFRRGRELQAELESWVAALHDYDELPFNKQSKELRDKIRNAGGKDGVNDKIEALRLEIEANAKQQEDAIKQAMADPAKLEEARKDVERTKVVFLSATPFNTALSLDYTEGYIFSYPDKKADNVYETSQQREQRQSSFVMEKFPSSHQRNKSGTVRRLGEAQITDPEKASEEEVAFSDYLQNDLGVMSGRQLDSQYDYSREFPLLSDPMSKRVNEAINALTNGAYKPLAEYFRNILNDYANMTAIFEIIKTRQSIERIREHIAQGRKVAVYHRRMSSTKPITPPFSTGLENAAKSNGLGNIINSFRHEFADLLAWEKGLDYKFPNEQIVEAFATKEEKEAYRKEMEEWAKKVIEANLKGKKEPPKPRLKAALVGEFNGSVTQGTKDAGRDAFNNDSSECKVIVCQVQSAKEGIDLHDKTGKHQRVMMVLSLPESPIEFVQTEGRIYRVGSKSNAIFEYPVLGIDLEMANFAMKINGRSQTSENFSLGSQARGLRDSIARAALDARDIPVTKDMGTGGKLLDSKEAQKKSGYEDAVHDFEGWQGEGFPESFDDMEVPNPLGYKMSEWAKAENGETVLVPGAKRGSIANYVASKCRLVALEPNMSWFSKLLTRLGGGGRKILSQDFADFSPINKADAVVMNLAHSEDKTSKDAFGKTQDATNLTKALSHLDEGGRLIMVVSGQFDYEKQGIADTFVKTAEIKLPDFIFNGNASKILVIDRVSDETLRSQMEKGKSIDLSGNKDYNTFFRNLKTVDVPKRTIDNLARIGKRVQKASKKFAESPLIKKIKLSGKLEPWVDTHRGGMSAMFKTYCVPRVSPRGLVNFYNGFSLNYHKINSGDVEAMEAMAKNYLYLESLLKLSEDEMMEKLRQDGLWRVDEKNIGSFKELFRIQLDTYQAAMNKTPLQIKNIAEGKVENEVSGEMSVDEFEDAFKSYNSGNVEIGALADKVFAVIRQIPGLKFRVVSDQSVFSSHNTVAHYNPNNNSIELNNMWINSTKMSDEQKGQTLVHEMIHAATCYIMRRYEMGEVDSLSEKQRKACEDIFNVYNILSNDDTFRQSLRLGTKMSDNATYGLTNAYEMVAELANPIFRAKMKAKKLFNQLVNNIMVLFGMRMPQFKTVDETDALSVVERAMYDLMDNFDVQLYKSYANTQMAREMPVFERKVQDEGLIKELNNGPTVKLYRAMQLIGGKLYPPMAAKVNGKFVEPSELGKWEEAEERPEQIKSKDGKNKFTLNKGNGSQIDAAYNPYLHLSRSPLNDQFTSASQRPNLVTVEVEVPESELYSNYRAEGAKDTTGEMTWHAGPVSSRLPEGKKRKVVLSRWAKPVRIVPDKEVARKIADMLEGENIPIPSNTVTPSLRKELEALGVPVRDTDKKYRFIGEKGAAAIDQAKERDDLMQGLRAAKQMEQAGKDAKAIKLATGWERGADGLWRYEQPDFKLKTDNLREYMSPYIEKKAVLEKEMEAYRAKRIAKYEEMERMRKEHPENESAIDKLQKEFKEFYQKEEAARLDLDDYGYTYRVRDWEGAMLSDIIDEPELFDAYPILSHLHISASKRIEVDGAYYSPNHNAIEVGEGTKGEKLLSALIHEVQHAIQVQEGFARGGNEAVRIPLDKEDIQRIEDERDAVIAEMEEDKKKGLEENALARWQLDNLNKQLEIGTKTAGREGYMRIAGEVEARNAERRMNMTDEERRNSLATETEDKPRESQIILLDDVADEDRKALLGNDGEAYTDPAYAEAYSENNVNQAIYSVAGKYMKRLYAGGVLGRVLTGNNATINTDKAKKEFKLVSEVLGDYRKALESMAARCTDAALREIQAVMDKIDRSIEYYKQLAEGKDVWRTEEGSRYRLADALGGLSDVSRSSHLAMAQRAASVAERLHTPVRLVMSLDELSEEDRGAMGWYDTATGEVVIVVPNHTSVSEIEESVFHEAVGHKSMNELLGEEGFNEFLNDIYMNCDEETRKRIARKFVDGMTLREATEEAIAEIAEDMAHGRKPTAWEALKSCLKAAARKALRKLGFEANFEVNENDILYALWKNAKQMERGDVLSAAQSIAMQRALDTDFTGRRFRKVPTGTDYGTASQRYEAALNARSYRFREGFQDSMLALKELQDAVVAETKTKLREWEDAYTMENQLSSKDTADIEIYQRDFFNPMIDVFKRFLKKTGMTQAEGTRYLFAKSGLERNREFAVRDAINRVKGTDDVHPDLDAFIEHYYQEKYSCETDLEIDKITFEEFCERMDEVAKDLIAMTYYGHDGKPRKDSKGKEIDTDAAAQLALERDYSGLSDIFDPDTFRENAIECVTDTEARSGVTHLMLWDRINAATKETLRKSRDCGVTSVEAFQKVSGMFAWYIPMRGFDADMASDVYDYFGKGQGGFNATVKDAKGRLSLADNPLATIGNMAESAILQGNKNMMKTGLLNLAFSHPTHLLKVQKAWIENVGTEADPVWQYAYPDILPTDSAEDIADKLRDFEDEMKDKQEKGLAKHEYNRLDIPYVKTPDIVPEHLIRVKRNGREYVLILNGNPRAAQAVNGLLSSRGDESRAKKLIQQINRFMAGAFTTKNPTFIVRNLSRDLIFANSAVIAKEPLDYGNRFRKNQFTVMKKVGKLLYLYKHGRLDENDEWQRYFSEFIRNGGETGFTQLHSVEEYKQRMANALKQRNVFVKAGREAWTALFDCIEFGNRCAEDVSRFTTYATSRQMGRSIQRSVADAKEITVNFNKKGSGAKAGGVTGIAADAVRTLYLFSNAAIQGLVNVGRISKAHPFKAGAVVASFMAMGLAQPAINELLFSVLGGGDGDDDPYNNLPDFVRHSNLCFYVGNINGNSNFFTIPLSIELRAFFGLGEMLSQYGEGNISAGDAATEFATSLCELTPINFLGSGGVIDSATPDFAKPVEQILQNTDFTGKPIYRKSSFNTAYPEWTKAYSGTSKMLVKGCKALNELSGGDNVKSGMIDVNPAMVEHLVTGYTGGLGQTFIDVAKIMQMGMVPDYRNPRNVPIAKAFIRQSDERTSYASTKAQYQKYMEWYKEEQHLRSGYKKEVKKGGEDALEYADKQRHLLDGVNMKKFQTMKAFDKQVSALYKEIGSTEDEEIIKRDNGLILELKRRCVERMKSLEGR